MANPDGMLGYVLGKDNHWTIRSDALLASKVSLGPRNIHSSDWPTTAIGMACHPDLLKRKAEGHHENPKG